MQNHIKPGQSLAFEDFLQFVASRRATLKKQLMVMLNVSSAQTEVGAEAL